jgi:hypothetical protein
MGDADATITAAVGLLEPFPVEETSQFDAARGQPRLRLTYIWHLFVAARKVFASALGGVVAHMVVARLKVISYETCPLGAENELIVTWSSATGVSQSTIISHMAANITIGTWIANGGPTMTSGKKQLLLYFGRLHDIRKQRMTCFVG